MSEPFRGVVNLDIRDSTPDWAAFSQAIAPPGTPNVVYVVLDDVGFGALGCYGGLIETPNIDRIPHAGLPHTQGPTTRRRPALHPVAHHRAVLADAVLPADRAQPHGQRHGLHHRGRDGFPERQRA